MTFSQKFDFLLKLSATSNSVLAHRMRLDPSYISKLRHGSRALPRSSEHALKICSFIVSQCVADFQMKSLCETVNISANASSEDIANKVLDWLYDDGEDSSLKLLLNDFSSVPVVTQKKTEAPPQQNIMTFYGAEGHFQAYSSLLRLALDSKKAVTLLLYNDDDSALMNKSSSFFYEWTGMLWQIILQGGKIKIIHKVSNDIDEMLDVIRRWLPFFVSGAVESYYYPGLRDGIYKRSLSVVPNVAASFSTSIGQESGIAPMFLVQDSQTVDSLTNEFYSYAALCKPLVEFHKIYSNHFLNLFQDYLDLGYESIIKSDSLPLTTIPSKVFRSLEARIKPENASMLRRINKICNNKLLAHSGMKPVNHILRLASPDEVTAGTVPVSCVGMLEGSPVYYTVEEYCAQLEHILWMMKSFPWFNVILDRSEPCGYSIHVFERQDVYIFKGSDPYIIFRFQESNIVLAFYEYLHRMQTKYTIDREDAEKEIRACLDELRNH